MFIFYVAINNQREDNNKMIIAYPYIALNKVPYNYYFEHERKHNSRRKRSRRQVFEIVPPQEIVRHHRNRAPPQEIKLNTATGIVRVCS